MKKILSLGLCFGLFLSMTGCDDSSNDESSEESTMVNAPYDSDDIPDDLLVDDIVSDFEEAGFTNIEKKPMGDLVVGFLSDEGEVETIKIGESEDFTAFEDFEPNEKVIIEYHSYPEEKAIDDAESEGIINASNNAEFAEILQIKDPLDEKIQRFAEDNMHKIIEFDGNVVDSYRDIEHDSIGTYLIYAGNYDLNSIAGPSFHMEYIPDYSLNIVGDNSPSTLETGMNIHIKAKIGKFNEKGGLFEIYPEEITIR